MYCLTDLLLISPAGFSSARSPHAVIIDWMHTSDTFTCDFTLFFSKHTSAFLGDKPESQSSYRSASCAAPSEESWSFRQTSRPTPPAASEPIRAGRSSTARSWSRLRMTRGDVERRLASSHTIPRCVRVYGCCTTCWHFHSSGCCCACVSGVWKCVLLEVLRRQGGAGVLGLHQGLGLCAFLPARVITCLHMVVKQWAGSIKSPLNPIVLSRLYEGCEQLVCCR